MTWKKKWILPCLLAVFLTGCQGGKQEIPYISDGSVSWDAVEKAEIYGGGCAVPPTGTISGENGLEELVEAALETEGYRLLPEKEWLEGTMDLWVRFDNGVVIGLYQDCLLYTSLGGGIFHRIQDPGDHGFRKLFFHPEL